MMKATIPTSRSDAVRELLRQEPALPTAEVLAKLAKKDIKVSPSLVYVVRNKLRALQKEEQPSDTIVVDYAATDTTSQAVELIRGVQALARRLGGMKALQELVGALDNEPGSN